jgi:hypothetical protein
MITRIQKIAGARVAAMLMLVFWCASVLAPLAASAQEQPSPLPICCRTHGAHHCSGGASQADPASPAVSERCPHISLAASVAPTDAASYPQPFLLEAAHAFIPLTVASSNKCIPTRHSNTNSQRGPPTSASSL